MMETLRLGLAGRGVWATNIHRTLVEVGGIGVVEVDGRAEPASDLDAMVVATSAASHGQVALPYVEAGIPTFIEKPMVTSSIEGKRLVQASERAGAVIFVGHLYLHHPAFLAALELLPRLGAIRDVHCVGMNDRPRSDSSVFWDWLPHHLSMAEAVLGRRPSQARARRLSGEGLTEAGTAEFGYGDVSMTCVASWRSAVPRLVMRITGDQMTLVFDDRADCKLVLLEHNRVVGHPSYSSERPLTRELRAFVAAVRADVRDAEQVRTGISVVEGIEAAEQSADLEGRTIYIGG